MTDHLVIYDTQIKPSTDLEFTKWFGNYIDEHKPDVIVCIGDWWDMPSLSSYDKPGSAKAVGRNYHDDVQSGILGMSNMLGPMIEYNEMRRRNRKSPYRPQMHFTMGNHEERIARYVDANPTLIGTIGYHNLKLEQMGWTVHDFLMPVIVDGVQYVHYVKNKNSNYPKASAKATIEQTFMSTVQGHKPGLDVYCVWSDQTGSNAWSIINGSSYTEDESFRRGSGNAHWRGITHFRNVKNGDFDPVFVSMECLRNEYA